MGVTEVDPTKGEEAMTEQPEHIRFAQKVMFRSHPGGDWKRLGTISTDGYEPPASSRLVPHAVMLDPKINLSFKIVDMQAIRRLIDELDRKIASMRPDRKCKADSPFHFWRRNLRYGVCIQCGRVFRNRGMKPLLKNGRKP